MGLLSTLLAWHQADPPDAGERERNEVIYSFQGNRNPFIDHPEWATSALVQLDQAGELPVELNREPDKQHEEPGASPGFFVAWAKRPARARRYNCRMPVLLAYSTCPDAASAEAVARALVDERLAACVNQLPGLRSTYRWQGQIEQADEVLLLIKTTADRLDALTARLRELHPYELPELIAVEVRAGLPAYLDWVAAEHRPATRRRSGPE